LNKYISKQTSIFLFQQATGIQAAIRQHIQEHQRGGNLLKAEVGNGHVNQAHVPLTFTGTRTDDKRTEFYLEKTESGECLLICTMRCELGDQNNRYYLCADDDKDGKVFLLKSNSEDLKDKKFMFEIKVASDGGHYYTIMSLSTGMFLVSDNEGNASLKRFKEQPEDLQTWFHFLPHVTGLMFCNNVETHTLGVGNFNYDSIQFATSYCQASEVEAC